MKKLIFGLGNAKLSKSIATFSLPAGHTCLGAKDCLSKADKLTGKLTDGKDIKFRCFAASQECIFPSVRNSRWNNLELLKKAQSIENMANLIQQSLPFGIGLVRCHVGGDFFNERYFLAWLNVAINNPYLIIYGYTKALPFIVKYKKYIPSNFRFVASVGGKYDNLIEKHNLRNVSVSFSTEEARLKGLPIDHDDSEAIYGTSNFTLLLHGIQKANSIAGKALQLLKKQGLGGYNESKKQANIKSPIKIHVNLIN